MSRHPSDRVAGFLLRGIMAKEFFIGTAGWNIPIDSRASFPATGSHLERYAQGLSGVEINSSFYRHHMPVTYRRWAQSTPAHFRFSVKLAKAFTHEAKLVPSGSALRTCLEGVAELGEKWGALLVQLPPSLVFEKGRAENFLGFLKEHCPVPVVWEPRHASWTHAEALSLLERFAVGKVIADPEPCPAPLLRTDETFRYYRLHGSPEIYRSRYRGPYLARLAQAFRAAPASRIWCIFDNTTFGWATTNALELKELLHHEAMDRKIS